MTKIIQSLFRKRSKTQPVEEPTINNEPITKELPALQDFTAISSKPPKPHLPQIIVGCAQSAGRERETNEDALYTLTTNLVTGNSSMFIGLYIIADGMGGHRHGEIASATAIQAIVSHILHNLYAPYLHLVPYPPDQTIQETIKASVQTAQHAVRKESPGGGTTLTGVLILGNQMTVFHVGDCRTYLQHPDGRMDLITRDHSLVKRLEELGQISSVEAGTHPQRNVLYRAVGQEEPFEPDISTQPLPSGQILICSDGLWGVLPESRIQNILSSQDSPDQVCQTLVDEANLLGGPDNISAILLRLPG